MHPGKTFREIRQLKGVSLIEASENILTKSALSKFERGESDLGISKFIQLIYKLNLTLEEFEYHHSYIFTYNYL